MRRSVDPAHLFLASAAILTAFTSAKWIVLGVRLVDDLALEPYQLALLGTALELGVLTSEIPTGVIADVISRRASIILSYLVMGPAMALSGLVEPIGWLALTHVIWGIGWTMQSGADVAWLTDEIDDSRRVEGLLLARGKIEAVAAAAGVPLALALNAVLTRTGAIVAASLSLFVWGLVLVAIMPEHGFVPHRGESRAEFMRVLRLGGRLARRTPSLRIVAAATLLGGLASEVVDRLDVARLVEVGLPDTTDEVVVVAGLALAKAVVSIVALRAVERRLIDGHAARLLMLLYLGTGATVAVIAGSGLLAVVFGAFVVQEGLRVGTGPLEVVLANRHDESSARATVLSFMSQAHALGEIVGGVTLGILASATSLATAFVASALLFVAAGLVAGRGQHHGATPAGDAA